MELTKEQIDRHSEALMNAIAQLAQDEGFENGFVMLGRSKYLADGRRRPTRRFGRRRGRGK